MNLFEIVEESCDALQSGLALTLNLDLELDFSLADTTQVLDVVQLGNQSYATAGTSILMLLTSIIWSHM